MRKLLAVALLAVLAACSSDGANPGPGESRVPGAFDSPTGKATVPAGFSITSAVLHNGEPIAKKFTCDGFNVSPALSWVKAPKAAKAFAVTLDDPDAPSGTFIHWVVWDIPVKTKEITQGEAPKDAKQARNDAGNVGYTGPCPPKGQTHHYKLTLYALRSPLGIADGTNAKTAEAAIRSASLAETSMTMTYKRA